MQDVLSKMDLFQNSLQKNGFIEHSERVKQKQKDFNEPFMLMIIGEGNYGKSTLINSLFNNPVAPVSRLPKTWKIDIYENSENDEAILYYRDKNTTRTVSLEEANKICDEEENKSKQNENWKSDLFQVKWRVKSDWLENILLIDTPGFSQFRSSSNYSNFNLFGTKGIQLESFDGFEYYFYRADFVFWCIKATKLEDSDTLNALKTKSTGKDNIVGIITFMERIPIERWAEIKKKSEELYGEYIKEFHFFTSKEKIEGLGNNTVDKIREYINDNIKHNLPVLKNSSLLNYYNEELHNYCISLEKIADLYDKNINKYLSLLEGINQDCNLIERRIETERKRVFESITSTLEEKLKSIYLRANNIPDKFKQLVENELLNRHSLQKQIDQIYLKIKNDISSHNIALSRKLIWNTVTITNKNYLQDENPTVFHYNDNLIESFNANSNLADDFLFDGLDGFNMAVGGIAATIGLFALGPIGLIAGALGFLFGESKQSKVIRKAKEEIKNYINKIDISIKNEITEILKNYKNNLIEKVDNSFIEYNGKSKDEIIQNFYWTDSTLSNQLKIVEDGSIIDCLNEKKQKLTYFPKLLKYDHNRKIIWDRNAERLFEKEVESVVKDIIKEIGKVEMSVMRLIDDNKLSDLSSFNNEFDSLEKYFTKDILANPFLQSKDFIERLVYCNGEKVHIVLKTYKTELNKTKDNLLFRKKELGFLWDQKVIDLIWGASMNCVFKSLIGEGSKLSQSRINDFCDYKYQLVYYQIYSEVISKTKIFDAQYEVNINSQFEIRENLIHKFESSKFSFKERIIDAVEKDVFLLTLKSLNILDVPKFIEDYLQGRLANIINDLPAISLLKNTYKRFSGRILLSSFPLLIIGVNYVLPFNFIEAAQIRKAIQLILDSELFLASSILLFLFMILLQIMSRMKMKKDIKLFIHSSFKNYSEELYKKIQINFTNIIDVTK